MRIPSSLSGYSGNTCNQKNQLPTTMNKCNEKARIDQITLILIGNINGCFSTSLGKTFFLAGDTNQQFLQDFADGAGSRKQWEGVLFDIEESNPVFFKLENLQKHVKKSMKNYNFLKICKGMLRVFESFIEVLAKIQGKIQENLEFLICRGFGGRSPRSQRKY